MGCRRSTCVGVELSTSWRVSSACRASDVVARAARRGSDTSSRPDAQQKRLDGRSPRGQLSSAGRTSQSRLLSRPLPSSRFPSQPWLPPPNPPAARRPTRGADVRFAAASPVENRFLPASRPAVHRQRVRGADLRDRLVPAPQPHRRLVRRLARRAARHVHGRHVHRKPVPLEVHLAAAASAAGLRDARGGHRGVRTARVVGAPIRRRAVLLDRGPRHERRVPARPVLRALPAAAHAPHGRDAAGDRALGRDDAGRRGVARLLLRRQHRRRGVRLPARRLLSAPRARHGVRDVRRRRDRHRRRARQPRARQGDATTTATDDAPDERRRASRARFRRARGRSTSRSASPARRRSPPKRCGRACCRCSSARRRTRSRSFSPRSSPDSASAAASARCSRASSRIPKRALGVCQMLLTAAIAWAAYTMTRQLPYWPITPGLSPDPSNPVPDRHRALPVGRAARGDVSGARASRSRSRRSGRMKRIRASSSERCTRRTRSAASSARCSAACSSSRGSARSTRSAS